MKHLLLPLIALVLLCTSCRNRTILDESHSFDNDTWLRFEPEEFAVPVSNSDMPYCLTVSLRYDTSRFNEAQLPLVVDFFQDSNELHNITPTIRLRDKKGNLLGEHIDRYCTVTDTIDRFRIYSKPGTYTYRIKQRTSKYQIGGIASIALKVEQAVK